VRLSLHLNRFRYCLFTKTEAHIDILSKRPDANASGLFVKEDLLTGAMPLLQQTGNIALRISALFVDTQRSK
jgi:hypothetical protein